MERLGNDHLADINQMITEDPGPPSGAGFFLPRRKAVIMDAMDIHIKAIPEPGEAGAPDDT